MTEPHSLTTVNGYEITHPREKLSFVELQELLTDYGLVGDNPSERVEALKNISDEGIFMLMGDINKRLQGSDATLISEKVMWVALQETVRPNDRYNVFMDVIDKVKHAPDGINPARIGDTLALAVVLLHPFHDGNGRTARMFGLVFHDDFDSPEAAHIFELLSEPRQGAEVRSDTDFSGYIPHPKGRADLSYPPHVAEYIDELVSSDDERLYSGPYGQATLYATPSKSNS